MTLLPNLGPKSAALLAAIGITQAEHIAGLGAVGVYYRLEQAGMKVSLNLLWAMAAGLQQRHWTALTASEKARLLMELEEWREWQRMSHAAADSGDT